MLDLIKTALDENKKAPHIMLAVLIMAVGGSYKLLTDDLAKVSNDITEMKKELRDDLDMLHDLDKRITVLEIKND